MTRAEAGEQMSVAKRRFTDAARAALAGDPAAAELARVAFADVQRARAALAAAREQGTEART